MMMQPIVVIVAKKSKGRRYHCIGGIRTLMLAKSLLPQDYKAPIIILDTLQDEEIESLVCADALLNSFLYSVRNPSSIGKIFLKSRTKSNSFPPFKGNAHKIWICK